MDITVIASTVVNSPILGTLNHARARAIEVNNSASAAGGEIPICEVPNIPIPTIYRVPDVIKNYADGDCKYYRPVIVSVGFYANDRKGGVANLEKYKWRCLWQLIGRNNMMEPAKTYVLLQRCIETMKGLLPRVWASYHITDHYDDNDELEMHILLDGCFILHRVLKYASPGPQREDDDWTQVIGHCFAWQLVMRDLLLLENQIPFFVVTELFHLLKNDGESEELLFTGSLQLFRSLGLQIRDISPGERGNIHHFMHLFYLCVGFPEQSVPVPYRIQEPYVFLPDVTQWVPSAKELEQAGVKFRKKRNATGFLDISFDHRHGILEIPLLQLHDSSSVLFRNLIAFEQAYPVTRCNISTYAMFMDCLIKTPEDMRILHQRGILVNQMNNKNDFFSKICAQVYVPEDNYLVSLMQAVNRYKDSRRHKWCAMLVQNYFGNPWLAMSVLAAVLLLALTMLQTFFTVYPYYKPK